MSFLGMGTHGKDFQQQSASAVYSLTFEETQSKMGGLRKDSSSMNMDEFLKNIWTAEGSHAMAVALAPPDAAAAARAHADLQRQSSLTLPRTISQKIVDEVWLGLIRDSAGGAGGSEFQKQQQQQQQQQQQPNLGEMTLKDFLVRAGVVREEINRSVTGSSANFRSSVYHGELSASGNNNAGFTVMPSSSIPANSGANFSMSALAGMMRYAPQLPLDSNVDLGSTQGMRGGGFCGTGYPEISNGFIHRAVGLGGGEGVSVSRANQIPSDWLTKGNGELSSLSPVPYTCGGGMRGRKRSGAVEKVVERRQMRMIKNRESASRSRARKQTAKLYAGNSIAFGDKNSSRPYIWAQHLAGMDFLPEVPLQADNEVPKNEEARCANVSSGLSLYRHQHRVQTVLERIRSRKKAQLALVEQLNSLAKFKWPLLDNENVPWALHAPLCSLQQWLPVGPLGFSCFAVAAERVVSLADRELDRRSVTPWEVESVREDGELPIALPAIVLSDVSGKKDSDGSPDLDCSRNLALISKNLTPPKMVKSLSLGRHEDNLDLILDTESDLDEKLSVEPETEIVSSIQKPWVDHALREFLLVLCRKDGSEQMLKLEAKVKISIEYPLSPPLFSLRFSTDGPLGNSECYNELRYMESEVNLHIFNILSVEHENYVLAHQIRCLAMLFDLHFNSRCENRKSSSIVDARCQPVDTVLARVVRGRDRSRIFPWKGLEYPC